MLRSDRMKILPRIRKTREYLDYIEEHVRNVYKAWEILQEECMGMSFVDDDEMRGLVYAEILSHDLSKLSEQEFVQYRKAFYPTEDESKFDINSTEAWENHKKENPHHWQNWTKQKFTDPRKFEVHCVCMIVDWMAMGYKFNDTAQVYYEKNKDKIKLPNHVIIFMYEIFDRIRYL